VKTNVPKIPASSEAVPNARQRMRRIAEKKGLDRVIARRVLAEQGSDQETVVTLGAPRCIPGGEWICPFLINPVIDSRVQFGYGVDSVQALQSALQGIHAGLKKTGRKLKWMGIAGTGFPAQIPGLMGGKRFESRLEAEILREQKRLSIDRLRAWKKARETELSAFEAESRLLKKAVAQPRSWMDMRRLRAEIQQRESDLERFKENLQRLEKPKNRKNKPTTSAAHAPRG
jgi:hypothetical protein